MSTIHTLPATPATPTYRVSPTAWAKFSALAALGVVWGGAAETMSLPPMLASWTGWVLLLTLSAATVVDLRERRIPNVLTYPAMVWLLALSILNESGFGASLGFEHVTIAVVPPSEALAGALLCFGVMFFVFVCRGGGGGDVKLAALIGAAYGPMPGLIALAATHIFTGIVGLSWGVVTCGPVSIVRGLWRFFGSAVLPVWIAPPTEADKKFLHFPVPMSPFFFLGAVAAAYRLL